MQTLSFGGIALPCLLQLQACSSSFSLTYAGTTRSNLQSKSHYPAGVLPKNLIVTAQQHILEGNKPCTLLDHHATVILDQE